MAFLNDYSFWKIKARLGCPQTPSASFGTQPLYTSRPNTWLQLMITLDFLNQKMSTGSLQILTSQKK
jgi:hypothetical protein